MTAVSVRAWTQPEGGWPSRPAQRNNTQPSEYVLVFDCETTTTDQRLQLLVWRLYIDGALVTEGIAYPDEADQAALDVLRCYVDEHQADTEAWTDRRLLLVPLSEWIDHHLHRYGYVDRAAVVGFNLPFDLGAIAGDDWTEGRKPGSFTFRIAPRYTSQGRQLRVHHRPDLTVRHLDNGALIGWTGCRTGERDHRDGRRWRKGEPIEGTTPYQGRFVDCSTLHFALTGSKARLEDACATWKIDAGKVKCDFDQLDERLIDHCRADVGATAALHRALLAELRRHPGVELADSALWSPATVATRYLDAMGVRPLLDRFGIPPEVHAAARCASYGGRTEARIVRHPVPVVSLDVASMYPTVSALLGTWSIWTAAKLATEDVTDGLVTWLASDGLDEDDLYDPATWRRWGATLVELEPSGDVLPHHVVDDEGKARLVTAPLTFKGKLWWSWPDVAAAVLAGDGTPPRITRAIRLRPERRQRGLHPVKLRGGLKFDPRTDDPFAFLVAARHQAERSGKPHLARFYKVMANSLAHGLPGRYDHRGNLHEAVVYGPAGGARQRVRKELPGRHAFPAIASTTMAGARLILAMAERAITDLGGCWAHCDTDSAKIVATRDGGLVPCPGGPHRIAQEPAEGAVSTKSSSERPEGAEGGARAGLQAVRALSWEQVAAIARRFDSLRPEGSQRPLWSEEHDSLHHQLYALVTGPKSYAVWRSGGDGVVLVAYTETGLGETYLSPDPGWSGDAWRQIVRWSLGDFDHEAPAWWDALALRRDSITSPTLARAAEHSGVAARPFGFRLAGSESHGGASMVAPFNLDPATWPHLDWRDRRTGATLAPVYLDDDGEVVTGDAYEDRSRVDFTLLASVVRRIELQAVPAFDDPATGAPDRGLAKGLLRRRPTVAERLQLTGADRVPLESNGELPDQRYPVCQRCGKPLDGRGDQRWCSDACRVGAQRDRAKKQAEPQPERICAWSGCCAVLTSRQPTWCTQHRKRGTMAAARKRAWLERLERIGGRPCSDESCRVELFGGARCSLHEKQAS